MDYDNDYYNGLVQFNAYELTIPYPPPHPSPLLPLCTLCVIMLRLGDRMARVCLYMCVRNIVRHMYMCVYVYQAAQERGLCRDHEEDESGDLHRLQ